MNAPCTLYFFYYSVVWCGLRQPLQSSVLLTNERPTWCHLLFYFTYYVLNMFRTLIFPSSRACDCVDKLPHQSSCSFCRLKPAKRTPAKTARTKSSNTQRTENKTTDVVIHQHSRKVLKMDILISETCGAHNKWNKIASDIKCVFHSSTIAMMHRPINISVLLLLTVQEVTCWVM